MKPKRIAMLLVASLSACAVPDKQTPVPVARGAATVKPAPARAMPAFRTLDRQTERAIEPPAGEPLIVTRIEA